MRFAVLICCCFSLFLTAFPLDANPFAIQFPIKEEVTDEDYLEIQKQLRAIDIRDLIRELYIPNQGFTSYEDFMHRCSKGISQVLIDPDKGYFPIKHLEKIGAGSDRCIVCCAPFDGLRSHLIRSIPAALQATGFNGYFYYRIGGFPNPTGKEIQYAAVPYCFKIFMMMEAEKLGFNKVLWIDSACLPLHDPTPLFQWIDHIGILLLPVSPSRKYLFPATHQLIKDLTGVDILKKVHPCTTVFGLKMGAEKTKRLIKDYYRMVDMGTPFLSCFPEEFVLSSLIAKHYPSYSLKSPYRILKGEEKDERIAFYQSEGFFFYHRHQ